MSQSNTNMEKQENIKFISDFLLRLSEIAGNARLSYDKGIYYLNVEMDNGNYINYSVSDFEIQNFLHKGMRNIFSRGTSDRMIQNYEDKRSQKNEGTYKQFANDNYPWEALWALPKDLKITTENRFPNPDPEKEEKARQLSKIYNLKGWGGHNAPTDEEKEEQRRSEPLIMLLSNIIEVSPNVSMHTVDGRYYISVPTKDGHCMIYSTADWNLDSRDNHIFQWIKATRDIITKSISEDPEEEMSNIGGKLMQHDATAYEIGYNLPKDLGLEYDATEIGKYLERVARRGTKEAAESAISGEQSKEEKYYGGE